jgi:hypothetical protein
MAPVNTSTVLTDFATAITFDENTVNAAPQLLDVDVSFTVNLRRGPSGWFGV